MWHSILTLVRQRRQTSRHDRKLYPLWLWLFDRWSEWMHERGSAKMIIRGGMAYLERRYLLTLGRFSMFLHTFYQDDPDPPHDHPWAFGRVILSGWYREHYHDGTSADFGPGHIVWRRSARVLHRVELIGGFPVTTIFWHWKRTRTWGFLHDEGWRATSESGQDGRLMAGVIFPRKIGPEPEEVKH